MFSANAGFGPVNAARGWRGGRRQPQAHQCASTGVEIVSIIMYVKIHHDNITGRDESRPIISAYAGTGGASAAQGGHDVRDTPWRRIPVAILAERAGVSAGTYATVLFTLGLADRLPMWPIRGATAPGLRLRKNICPRALACRAGRRSLRRKKRGRIRICRLSARYRFCYGGEGGIRTVLASATA